MSIQTDPKSKKNRQIKTIASNLNCLTPNAIHLSESAGIRTQDPQLRRLLLYPAELPIHLSRGVSPSFFDATLAQKAVQR